MVKLREPLSIEDAVRQAHALLGDGGVKAATGKSGALALKWSDPDDDAHHIQLRQAIALDLALIAAGHQPTHMACFHAAIEAALPEAPQPPRRSLSQHVTDLAKEFGDVAGLVVQAEADGTVTRPERRRLHDELQQLIDCARATQRRLKP